MNRLEKKRLSSSATERSEIVVCTLDKVKAQLKHCVLAPSGGPEGLRCAAAGPTALRASWRAPAAEARGGLVTHYTLQYSRKHSDPLAPPQEAHLTVQCLKDHDKPSLLDLFHWRQHFPSLQSTLAPEFNLRAAQGSNLK
ncbi:Receptor-type tyrosine-protein phosphatase F [Eumeta japonica]|uniref:Receptor-type tyrosine-protein phosphatase F n=1 Tax=Eumeta variegata TaxID=151549 RepID=A0A4C1XPL3_EUMVA|nr:Receptor-type tyrosine-protein phosphatase F [Eumeta japonica]